jgi:L-cystine uptake protein TcyP (sodium:dicarboxylate symporter family)
VFVFFDLQSEKLVFLTRVVHSQSTLQRQIKKKKHALLFNKLLNLIPVEPFFSTKMHYLWKYQKSVYLIW